MSTTFTFDRRSFATGIAALAAAGSAFAQQRTVLRVGHTNAQGEIQDEGLRFIDKRLRDMSSTLELQVFPNGQLGAEVALVEGLLIGSVDMTVVSHAVFANFVKAFQIFDMPFLVRDYAHAARIAQGSAFAELQGASRERGFRLLGLYSSGVRHLMTRRPIQSIDDLKGMKIRTFQNPNHLAAFQAFGANPIPLPYNELYGALQTGVVDGAEAAYTNYVGAKFYEVAPNWATVGWLGLMAPVVMSERKFQSLPKPAQEALDAVGRESTAWEIQLAADTEKKLAEQVRQLKVTVTNPATEPFRQAVAPLLDKVLTTDLDKRLLKLVRDPA